MNTLASQNGSGLVSVIIPVYNVEECLPETLRSVQKQTYRNWECICVDDGSKDRSPDIVLAFAAEDPRFRLVRQPNQGPGAARNNGIAQAQGEFIIMLDSDDLIAPALMQTCVERLQADGSDLCIFGHRTFCGQEMGGEEYLGMPVEEEGGHACSTVEELGDDIFFSAPTYSWNRMYRASVLKGHHITYTGLKHWEDVYLCTLSLAHSRRISFVRKAFYLYRQQRAGALTTGLAVRPEICLCFPEAYRLTWEGLKECGLLPRFGTALLLRFMQATGDFFRRPLTMALLRQSRRDLEGMFAAWQCELQGMGVEIPPRHAGAHPPLPRHLPPLRPPQEDANHPLQARTGPPRPRRLPRPQIPAQAGLRAGSLDIPANSGLSKQEVGSSK